LSNPPQDAEASPDKGFVVAVSEALGALFRRPSSLFSSPEIADDFSVVYKNKLYRTLGQHRHTHAQRLCEFGKMRPVPSGWSVCAADDDALKVCSSFSWQCEFLVFADGSAAWTSGSSPPTPRPVSSTNTAGHHPPPPAASTAGQSSSASLFPSFFGANSVLAGSDFLLQSAGQYAPAAKDGGWDGDVMLCRAL
jgi:hypothetical protein